MAAINRKPAEKKFSEDLIRKGLQELEDLYKHDYGTAMPKLRPAAGFADDREAERIGRLIGVALKKDIANKPVKIDRSQSNTGSGFAYEFDLEKLKASGFTTSKQGKIYAALLEQTKFMVDEGVRPEISLEDIYRLPPNKRAAKFAEELAYEGRTFRAILRAVRFVTCNPSIRSGFAGVVAAQAGTPAAAAAAAGFLAVHIPWIALFPPVMVTAVVGLIVVMGVEGFCAWSGPYLAKFSKIVDRTSATGGDNS